MSYAPIAKASELPEDKRERLRVKFDIAHFVSTENLPYMHYPQICHGVQVGTSYLNENAGKDFVHYIAMAKQQVLLQHLTKAKFFSLLLDGSTDKGNINNKVLLAVMCDPDGTDEKVHTRMDYLTVS